MSRRVPYAVASAAFIVLLGWSFFSTVALDVLRVVNGCLGGWMAGSWIGSALGLDDE